MRLNICFAVMVNAIKDGLCPCLQNIWLKIRLKDEIILKLVKKKWGTPRPQQMLQNYIYTVSRNLNFCKASPCNIAFSRIRGFGLHQQVNRENSRCLRLLAWEDTYRDPKPNTHYRVLISTKLLFFFWPIRCRSGESNLCQ